MRACRQRRPAIIPIDRYRLNGPEALTALVRRWGLLLGLAVLGAYLAGLALDIGQADGLQSPRLGVVGGDYLAFDTAADAFAAGEPQAPYDAGWFRAALAARSGVAEPGMMWQYPPTFYFLIAPLALLPYLPGYVLWLGVGMALFALALRADGLRGIALGLALATPATMIVINQGQGSFLTAALMVVAVALPDRRPLLAGLAAGLLTVKPQLGLLLPLAYLAAGHWRAFGTAAVTAVALAGLSVMVMGAEIWGDFFTAILRLEQDFTTGGMATPVENMTTPLAALLLWGAPAGLAKAVQAAIALGLAAAVALAWRQAAKGQVPADLAGALVCAAAPLVTPYAYHYELVLLVWPCAVIARHGLREGWRPFEIETLLAGWALLLVSRSWGLEHIIPVGLVLCLAVCALILRRILEPAAGFAPAARIA